MLKSLLEKSEHIIFNDTTNTKKEIITYSKENFTGLPRNCDNCNIIYYYDNQFCSGQCEYSYNVRKLIIEKNLKETRFNKMSNKKIKRELRYNK